MSKLTGYIIAVVGLAILVLSLISSGIPIISGIPVMYTMFAGVIAIIVGIAISMGKSSWKIRHAEEEVPIYEGTGKRRKIIGYRKER